MQAWQIGINFYFWYSNFCINFYRLFLLVGVTSFVKQLFSLLVQSYIDDLLQEIYCWSLVYAKRNPNRSMHAKLETFRFDTCYIGYPIWIFVPLCQLIVPITIVPARYVFSLRRDQYNKKSAVSSLEAINNGNKLFIELSPFLSLCSRA